jgi:hypothetical protein
MRECAMASTGGSPVIVPLRCVREAFITAPSEEGTGAVQEIEFRSGHLCVDTDPALCVPCQERLDRQLALLPRVYGELEVALVPAPHSGDRVTGIDRPGIPLNGPAVEARAAIRGTLASWADLIVEGRTVRLPLRTVPALAAFLRRHLGWLAVHPAADDAAAEIDALLQRALQAVRTTRALHCTTTSCGV